MLKAFTYIIKDNKIRQKYLTLIGLLMLCPISVLLVELLGDGSEIISVIVIGTVTAILGGYWVNCVKAISEQKNDIVLPLINIGSNFVLGLKCYISRIIYLFVWQLLLLTVLIGDLVGSFDSTLATILFPLSFFIIVFIDMALTWIFANTKGFWSYLRVNKAVDLILKNKKQYTLSALCLWIFNVVLFATTKLLIVTTMSSPQAIYAILLVFVFAIPYYIFITAYWVGKSISSSENCN